MMSDFRQVGGILAIGDPHIASRTPGFRRDDYPQAILKKLAWCLSMARERNLVPILLGDLFHWPRDNANWLLSSLLRMLDGAVYAIAGNHDCSSGGLSDDDSLSVLVHASRLKLLSKDSMLKLKIGTHLVLVGGTSWGEELPGETHHNDLMPYKNLGAKVFWITHHDPFDSHSGCPTVPGVDWVINGHIHRPMEPQVSRGTTWIHPGNISRIKRSDRDRGRAPAVLEIGAAEGPLEFKVHTVPHASFDDVFHPEIEKGEWTTDGSLFVRGLEELERRQTNDRLGLHSFLDQNLGQFDPRVAQEIRRLADEVAGEIDE